MLKRSEWHSSISDEDILHAVNCANLGIENPGFCLSCGQEAADVEPDARNYRCESCGAEQVFGAEELMFHL